MRARGSQKSANIPTTPSAVPDVLGPDLEVVFCGINPGRVSAEAGAHFANPRNDFWRLLHEAGFTPRLYEPSEQFGLLELGIGITNAAFRTTKGSSDLRRGDFTGSRERLEQLARELQPRVDRLRREGGLSAARFGERRRAGPARAPPRSDAALFVLPSTSPANAAVPWDERRALVLRACRPRDGEAAASGRSRSPARHGQPCAAHALRLAAQVGLGTAGRWRRAGEIAEQALET